MIRETRLTLIQIHNLELHSIVNIIDLSLTAKIEKFATNI